MGRIVTHKHFNNSSDIRKSKFEDAGEILISRQKDDEGLYILNEVGEVVKINSKGGGGGGDANVEYVDAEIDKLSGNTFNTINNLSGSVVNYIDSGLTKLSGDVISYVDSGLTKLSGDTINLDEQNRDWTKKEIAKYLIDSGDTNELLEAFALKSENSNWDETDESSHCFIRNKPTVYTEDEIKEFAQDVIDDNSLLEEISGLTNDIKELSGNVLSDIEELSGNVVNRFDELSGITETIDELSGSVEDKLEELSGTTEILADSADTINKRIDGLEWQMTQSDLHVFLYPNEHEELMKNGRVMTEEYGEVIFSDISIYCIYEEDDVIPEPSSNESVVVEDSDLVFSSDVFDGDIVDLTEKFPKSYVDENGILVIVTN